MAKYPLPERTPPSVPPRGRATRRGSPAILTIAPRQTRTRPLLPSLLRNIGPGSSRTLPTPGPLELVLHRHPGETSRRPSNLPTSKWRAPRKYIGSRQTNLPPWSGRAGAPGEGQSHPTLQPPRQLQTVVQSCNNRNGTTIGMKPNKSPKIRPLFTRSLHSNFVFNQSLYHFILNCSYSLPAKKIRYFSPEGPAVTMHSRREERTKGRKEDKILLHDSVH